MIFAIFNTINANTTVLGTFLTGAMNFSIQNDIIGDVTINCKHSKYPSFFG